MIKKNLYGSDEKKASSDYFDGNVTIKEIYGENNSHDQELYFVEFSKGALTTMHYHETEQFLIPVYGKGVVGELKKNSILSFDLDDVDLNFLDIGEIVSIPPNVLHFHGALPHQTFTHIAFRKMFDYDCVDGSKNPNKTQTRWASDFIPKELGSDDPDLIKTTLENISNKVNQSVKKLLLSVR